MEVILTNSIIATLLEELKEPEGYHTHSCEILQRMNTQQDCCYCLVTKVCLTPCDHLDYSMPGSFSVGYPRQEHKWVASPSQGIFLTHD